jgi:hypothetical protein
VTGGHSLGPFFMKTLAYLGALALATTLAAGSAQATILSFDSAGDTAGWTTDRYAPATFQSGVTYGGRTGTLVEATAVSDGANNRPAAYSGSFYNTQGKALDLAAGATEMSIDLYIDPLYANSVDGDRLASFWGVATDGDSAISAYPIVALFNVGGNLAFRGWDSNVPGGYFDLVTPSGALSTGWTTLGISLVGSNVNYSLNNQFAGSVDSGGSLGLKSVILQTYNTTNGVVDTAHWDNLTANVPEPATWAMMIMGFGLVGASARRRNRTAAFA